MGWFILTFFAGVSGGMILMCLFQIIPADEPGESATESDAGRG